MGEIRYVLKGYREMVVDKRTWVKYEDGGFIRKVYAEVVKYPTTLDRSVSVKLVGELDVDGKEELLKEME